MGKDTYRVNECLADRAIAEELIDRAKDINIIYCTDDTVLNTTAVQKLAKYIERLQKENKELKDKYIHEKVAKEEVEELLEDCIPKSKVKEMIEELKEKRKDYEEKSKGLQISDYFHRKFIELCHKINILEELLGEE